ncbi:MAG: phage integrase N-terminal SAM-like domain-containing protein [Lentisphaeria bacterium]|nr:phage integrase N-terminal SAM-like domain-containing protein [Lentisphaeria bacterium]
MSDSMYGASGQMTGLGTSHLFAGLICELIGACAKAVYAAGKTVITGGEEKGETVLVPHRLRETLVANGYAPSTARKYEACVLRFLEALGCSKLAHIRDDDVLAYLDWLVDQGLGNGSLRLHLCAVRAVFDNMLGMRITAGIVHAPRPIPRPAATEQELMLLREACTDFRTRLAIDMLNRSDTRPGVLVSLALAPPADGERENSVKQIRPVLCFPRGADVNWLFPSPVRPGPISLRTLQRRVTRLGNSLELRITCTAIRRAGEPATLGAVA